VHLVGPELGLALVELLLRLFDLEALRLVVQLGGLVEELAGLVVLLLSEGLVGLLEELLALVDAGLLGRVDGRGRAFLDGCLLFAGAGGEDAGEGQEDGRGGAESAQAGGHGGGTVPWGAAHGQACFLDPVPRRPYERPPCPPLETKTSAGSR